MQPSAQRQKERNRAAAARFPAANCRRIKKAHPKVRQKPRRTSKRLAEFAPAGANKVLTIFSGDLCVGKNPSRLANVRSKSVRCGEPRSSQMGETCPAGLSHLNIKKAHPKVRPLRNAVGVRLEPARLGRWVAARSLPRFQRPAKSREACNSRPEIGVPYI